MEFYSGAASQSGRFTEGFCLRRLHRHIFVVNRVGESGQHDLSMEEIKKVLQAKPASVVPFLPKVVTPAALHGLMAASKGGKFADAIGNLTIEPTGRQQRRKWFWQRKK
jgi:hypothetical protein